MRLLKKNRIPALLIANGIMFAALVGTEPAFADGVDDCDETVLESCACLEAQYPWYPAGCYDNAGAGPECTSGDECP